MRRGEIWLADLEPGVGSEAGKVRPVVLVSNDGANLAVARHGRGVVTVVPLTSNVAHIRPYQVKLDALDTGLGRDSKAQCEQVRAVDGRRLIRLLGSVPMEPMRHLDDALRLHLYL